jgi:hypothetical protein
MISTTNISTEGGPSIPKTLSPGNVTFKINGIFLDSVPYKAGAYNLRLEVEGPDMGSDFEGFFIDKDDPSKGRYAGQVARVRFSEYPYSDGVTPKGAEVSRDIEIVKALTMLCKNLDCSAWMTAQDNKHDTIESLVTKLNEDKPFTGKYLRACIAGREYTNKAGYTSYDLYLPKYSKMGASYESASVDEAMSKVVKFNPEVHIKKNKTTEAKSFGDSTTTTGSIASDFVL